MAETKVKTATDVLAGYRRWKEQGESLKMQAQGVLVDRFHELIQEAQQVQQDLFEDFGYTVKFPANPKHAKRGRSRTAAKRLPAAAKSAPASSDAPRQTGAGKHIEAAKPAASQKPSPSSANLRAPREEQSRKVESLARQVEKARQRLQEAKANGGAVKIQNAEDKLYELSDELRLMQSAL